LLGDLNGEATIGDAPDHRKASNRVLSKDYITAAIPGMTTRDQVDLNLWLMNTTAPKIEKLERAWPSRLLAQSSPRAVQARGQQI
jgi:hypothetical protein